MRRQCLARDMGSVLKLVMRYLSQIFENTVFAKTEQKVQNI
jgi:hypothetical protein